jgi:4-methylaminobutanoate oxidase (formaldehyde-forming)
MTGLPSKANIVVIGGGIVGCSTAYHLARHGAADVLVLEKGKLTSGSTWHAAGMVGQLRSSANITQLLRNSVELYARLEAETGQATGWRATGSLRLCCTKDRRIEYERAMTTAHSFNLGVEMLGPREIEMLCPGISVEDVLCGLYIPTDGMASPSDLTMALVKGARAGGCRFVEGVAVTDILVRDGRAVGVMTEQGRIDCEAVVLCAGLWSRELARRVGVAIPILPSHHHYIVTEKIAGLSRDMPGLRDPDNLTYFKEEVGGLIAGGYEPNPIPYDGRPRRDDPDFRLFPEEPEHFEQLMLGMVKRFPAFERVGVKQWFNGLESFTEDTNFILGEAPELRKLFVGCGFNSMGIAAGGGAGLALAHWVAEGEPPYDLWPVDIRRFSQFHRSDRAVLVRALEGQGHHYAMGWPHYEFKAGRPFRRSAIYDRLLQQGACFGAKAGWERPNWFAPKGIAAKDEYSFGRASWFTHVGEEHRACRERAALFDQSSFAKFLVAGRDAEKALQRICAANVAREPGRLAYTQMLNRNGGIECDLTVARLAEDSFYIVTGTAMAVHDGTHIRRNILPGENVSVIDVTSAYGVLGLMGPKAREILTEVAEGDVGSEAFPFGSVREIMVAGAPVRALRVTFVGELGWELHIPTEYMATVFEALRNAGAPHGLANAGYRAIDSLRFEKGYVIWGAEVGPDYTPLEAGLGFAVSFKKNADFIGKAALLRQRERPLAKRLMTFTVPDVNTVLLGRETIYRDGKAVGWLTGGGYGYTVGKGIGLGYVRNREGVTDEYLRAGRYELEVAGIRVPAEIHFGALYDPQNLRSRS